LNEEKVLEAQYIYFTKEKFHRMTEFKNLDRDRFPAGKTGLCYLFTQITP